MTENKTYRIGTRTSQLAKAQTRMLLDRLNRVAPEVTFQAVERKTTGDRFQDRSIHRIPGKGFFTRDLDEAVLEGEVHAAVHSAKDVPVEGPEDLVTAAWLTRTHPGDVLVSPQSHTLRELPEGSVVGTSSLRRQSQVLARRPDLEVEGIRGNVDTRLEKVNRQEEVDAIILAEAGLQRLDREEVITQKLPTGEFVPAPGQGALLVQTREDRSDLLEILEEVSDPLTAAAVGAERFLVQELDGGCRIPLGAHCQLEGDGSGSFQALVAHPEGTEILRSRTEIEPGSSLSEIVREAAKKLKDQGAMELIETAREHLENR